MTAGLPTRTAPPTHHLPVTSPPHHLTTSPPHHHLLTSPSPQEAALAAQFAQEAALEVLYCLSALSLSPPASAAVLNAKLAIAREPSMLPRLFTLLQQPAQLHVSRRAAQILLNLAGAPGNHEYFRQFEWALAYLALHPAEESRTVVAPIITDVLTELA